LRYSKAAVVMTAAFLVFPALGAAMRSQQSVRSDE